jgi:XTP/dITP diphosphohydrolase
MNSLLDLADAGIRRLIAKQKAAAKSCLAIFLEVAMKLVLASNNAKQAQGTGRHARAAWLGTRSAKASSAFPKCRRAALHLRRKRLAKARHAAQLHRPAGAGRRLRPVRRRLGGAPGVILGPLCRRAKSDARNNEKLLADLGRTRPTGAPHFTLRCWFSSATPTTRNRSSPKANGTARSSPAARGEGGFGYDPLFSSANSTRPPPNSTPPRRTVRLAPRQGAGPPRRTCCANGI